MEIFRNKGSAGVFVLFSCLLFLLNSCQTYDEKDNKLDDTPDRGKIYVSADESFKPIIDEQVKVYESNHPGTQIVVSYKPEAECLKDLTVDSVRMIISTRGFSEAEDDFIVDSLKISPRKMIVARDAVAVIVHPLAEDSLLTMEEIKAILTGKFKKNLIPVFDGVKATSTVRFIVDSILKNDSLTPNAMAARTSEGVIDYVAKNPQTIGFIGVSWIGNKEDSAQTSFLKKVKMVHLESTDLPGKYVLPYQVNIYFKRYPMVRDLVYILKERHRGLGTGFSDFLGGLQGQLIFKRAYLMPVQNNFIVRPVRLRE
ncbi:MAG TPA: substrate-binding domain-containing protein [Chitinophagaceae bacterium]|nr:substrate-binding domain-containing protein [Chitinophagaceae bacterium]